MISIIKFSLELFINFRISVDNKNRRWDVEIMIQSYLIHTMVASKY